VNVEGYCDNSKACAHVLSQHVPKKQVAYLCMLLPFQYSKEKIQRFAKHSLFNLKLEIILGVSMGL